MPTDTDRAGKSRSLLKGRKNAVPREKNYRECHSSEMTDALCRVLTLVVCFVSSVSLVCLYSM
jgi:hypothetical protein